MSPGVDVTGTAKVTAAIVGTAVAAVLAGTATVPATAQVPVRAVRTDVQPAPHPSTFTISSFNVLGASHTRPGGRRASGATRIVWAGALLRRHHVDVVGFQEMQETQLRKFLAITSGAWAVYPGFAKKRYDTENSIGWRTDRFQLLQATTVDIPYFDGIPRAMPLVLLRDKRTGMKAYFSNFHNPGDTRTHRHQGRWRSAATRVEVALQNQLAPRGLPRFMTGDMNDRAPYYCRVTRNAPLRAARPTSVWRDGACRAGRPRAVDWIFGARKAVFSGYTEDRSPLVDRTTDHPVISSDVTVDPDRLPRAWADVPAPVVPALSW
jgi:hypothetical protein